jgi:pyridoxamine 5'-phosphate oxidase
MQRHDGDEPVLDEDDVDPDPIKQFLSWYEEAGTEAVALITATADAVPSGRMVLLKGVDQRGFAFYTNYQSPKARDLAANPRAALLFFWPPDRQVRVSGRVTQVEPEESERYWRTRPRASQLSAWASRQSEVIESRGMLERRVAELDARFSGAVPSPPFWGGYRLAPEVIEFWQHREDRLHDRLRYQHDGDGWALTRLSP